MAAVHQPDCVGMFLSEMPVYGCGGTYVCPGCDRECGWCFGCGDEMPAVCDDCFCRYAPGWVDDFRELAS